MTANKKNLYAWIITLAFSGCFGNCLHGQQPAGNLIEDIKPAMSSRTVAILNIDLKDFQPSQFVELFVDETRQLEAARLRKLAMKYDDAFATLKEEGAVDITFLFRLGTWVPENRIAIIRCKNEEMATQVRSLIDKTKMQGLLGLFATVKSKGSVVYVSKSNSGRPNWASESANEAGWVNHHENDQLEIFQSLLDSQDSPVRFAFSMTADQARALGELDPATFVSGENNEAGIRNLESVTAGLDIAGKQLNLNVNMDDQISMLAVGSAITSGIQKTSNLESLQKNLPKFAKWLGTVPAMANAKGKSISLEFAGNDFQTAAQAMAIPVNQFLRQARYSTSANRLRQIILAMHNYHDAKGSFPPAYSVDDNGNPLLSWRVLILPFLGQNPHYSEFKQDEAWDSERNKRASATIPFIFSGGMENKTRFQIVSGAGTFGEEGIDFPKIADGTSNTIAVVETNSDNAVIWSKPDDLAFKELEIVKSLIEEGEDGFWCSFCDGSVHFIPKTIEADMLKLCLQPNDGNIATVPSNKGSDAQYNPISELPDFWFYKLIPETWVVGGAAE